MGNVSLLHGAKVALVVNANWEENYEGQEEFELISEVTLSKFFPFIVYSCFDAKALK